MIEAAIVATARTPLAKSCRGGFNLTHGATLGGHVLAQAMRRARLEPDETEDVIMGCAIGGGQGAAGLFEVG